jgi:CxxC motif-containing protein (DUF1111 family)
MTVAVSPGRSALLVFVAVIAVVGAPMAGAQWVEFDDETGTRITAPAGLGADDLEEKDYAWGDVDQDGDIDLVVVRKQPFTSAGKRVNVLFLNEGGVLVDRTADYAVATDVPGDLGFQTPTNDRDILLVDVNDDTWLDMVTAVTISDGDPKHIGHPRVYMNLGRDSGTNEWLGFRFEDFRVPEMGSYTNQTGFNPRFCSVAAGDVTGDGAIDLWFGDYDSSGAGGNPQPDGADFNDRILVNTGTGVFKDQTDIRPAIADINGDGFNDIVKQTSLEEPLYVGVAYNNPDNEGFFDTYEVVNNQSPYFISLGDLNQDDLLDIVITDDGQDRYLLNQGNGADGLADFVSFSFSYDAASDDGFGSNSVIADLNNDGWNDVLIADVDVDIGGCSRRLHVYRNLGGTPGGNVTLQEQTSGSGCATSSGNPSSCIVASIPSNQLEGVHDVAVFDLDGDGWKDMVVGRCSGTEVYINRPPVGLIFTYPQGLPLFVDPDMPFTFQMQVSGLGGAVPEPASARLFVSVAGAPYIEVALTDLGGDLYEATLPAAPCTAPIKFYFTADAAGGGGTFEDPGGAPTESYSAIAAVATATTFEEDVEGDVSGWTIVNDPSLLTGAWEKAEPVGTVSGGGEQAAPDEDAEASQDAVFAFVTENGAVGGASGDADVDGGPTDLISPPINLSGTDAIITYSRWFYTSGDDTMVVSVTADGSVWADVETIGANGPGEWQVSSFRVGDHVTPSATVQVRFRVSDEPNNSVTEGGVDQFRVDQFVCSTCTVPAECDDLSFCNGPEDCVEGLCVPGPEPCPGQECDEGADACVECVIDAHCDDGDFCNGFETCSANVCVAGSDPCGGGLCDDDLDLCVDCLGDPDCDDGAFCNGAETCVAGFCAGSAEACPGRICDEVGDACIGTVALQPRMGEPVLGLTAAENDRFLLGREAFNTVFTEPDGLGPTFNQNSCGACHNTPVGGSGTILVTRFGFNDDKGGGFDPLGSLGGSLLQAEALDPACEEIVPPEANVVAQRLTNSTLGFGLVEAIADEVLLAGEVSPPPGVSGRAHLVEPLEDPGNTRVGRFGWKAQVATVLSFSGDAALNEMGITNRLVGSENAPNGDMVLLATCDTVPDLEDGPDGEGFHFIDRVTDFQRFLAPPPQTPRSGMTGETVFNNIGCASCHVASFSTPDDVALEDALRNKLLKPYSDFLIHDMGQSADFIGQGDASPFELRTTPLWGVRVRDPLWHDGRVAGGTFADRITAAVAEHDALGSESLAAAQAFTGLSQVDKDAVIAFLDSLGRSEFDSDGDDDVDSADLTSFNACFTGPGSFYTPDDACAIHDVDQDGDVDDDDFDLFVAAAEGASGEIGTETATQLMLTKETGGDITLSWGDSCASVDIDYEIYTGSVGDFANHSSLMCSTGGATTQTLAEPGGDTYFLVVPTNGFREGGYGAASDGTPRPQGVGACFTQSTGACQ